MRVCSGQGLTFKKNMCGGVAKISEDEDVSSPQGSSAAPRYHAGAGCRAQCHGLGPAASGECASRRARPLFLCAQVFATRVRFLGWAHWQQEARRACDSDMAVQDARMHAVAGAKYPGARAAAACEYAHGRIAGLPTHNTCATARPVTSPRASSSRPDSSRLLTTLRLPV